MKDRIEIGTQIKLLREEKKIKQLDMAIRLGIEQCTYAKIENSQIKITVNRLIEISEIFEIPVSKFFSSRGEEIKSLSPNTGGILELFENQNTLLVKQLDLFRKIFDLIDSKQSF